MIKKQLGSIGRFCDDGCQRPAQRVSLEWQDAVAVFNTAGAGSYYQTCCWCLTGDTLEAGTGAFS